MFRIFLTNLGKYNEGELVGEWVDLPVDDDFEQAFEDIGINDQYEEWFITDYENDYGYSVSEYENIYELNELAERLESLDDTEKLVVEAYCDGVDDDLDDAIDVATSGDYSIYWNCNDMTDVAYEWVEEVGGISGVSNPENYFDFDSYGRDCRYDLDNMAYDDWEYEHRYDDEDEDNEDAEEFESPYDSYDDYDLGEMVIYDMYGGFENVSSDTIENYFDYEAFGRDMSFDGNFVFLNSGDCVEFY